MVIKSWFDFFCESKPVFGPLLGERVKSRIQGMNQTRSEPNDQM